MLLMVRRNNAGRIPAGGGIWQQQARAGVEAQGPDPGCPAPVLAGSFIFPRSGRIRCLRVNKPET